MLSSQLVLINDDPQSHLFSPNSVPVPPLGGVSWQLLYAKQVPSNSRSTADGSGPRLYELPEESLKKLTFVALEGHMQNRHLEKRVPTVTLGHDTYQIVIIGM